MLYEKDTSNLLSEHLKQIVIKFQREKKINLLPAIPSNCTELFTEFFNFQFGTNLTSTQLENFYLRKTGSFSNACLVQPLNINQPLLCSSIDSKARELYKVQRDSLLGTFTHHYIKAGMRAVMHESFTVTHPMREYHHTLYYYDQAGNLVKTVPPAGVRANYAASWLDSVKTAKAQIVAMTPLHQMVTNYRYNSLNQVVHQRSPDGGATSFWYDRLGRLVLSQNLKQKLAASTEKGKRYSYTLYDSLGRITEVGEIANATTTAVTNILTRGAVTLATWLQNSQANKSQITNTVYDKRYEGFENVSNSPLTQMNLRNRVSYTSIAAGNNPKQYQQATFCTYDIHGNVDTLLQDYGSGLFAGTKNVLNANNNRFKYLVYQYDLISGKVNQLHYQPGKLDQFLHRYRYDAENRLVAVMTSMDSIHWEEDARYAYYLHGPLARMELGASGVQGIDYAYTLQGWLKGVNSAGLNPAFDMGGDGTATGSHSHLARDVFSFGLHYFDGDYQPLQTASLAFPSFKTNLPAGHYRPLYNGNISSMSENLAHVPGGTVLFNYKYDQLNRITNMRYFEGFNQAANSWQPLTVTNKYTTWYAYDPNGNLKKLSRYDGTGARFDSLSYTYNTNKNQLNRVTDLVGAGFRDYDHDTQTSSNNYTYYSIGNLTRDYSEGITSIKWNVYGKISEIVKSATSVVSSIRYTYDASATGLVLPLSVWA